MFRRNGESNKLWRNGEGSEEEICTIQLGHKNLKREENHRHWKLKRKALVIGPQSLNYSTQHWIGNL
ncbi:hypothetical protein AKJ43_01780 [candidate division MSBL1 archaeon SCGC-AAA261D19]|uniref:Uncharacterized protein n=1 Tax=candidate division MSBL1 archaeon SCGC-AAA261D19 TaxID=1698273 RepID=A0A133V7N7_9EURY|nr:hypothetical protein AKJ43_01780 [candidate division MSBL1 archaeon SCGC-AAA261D19]